MLLEMKHKIIKPEFVELIPDIVEEGVLYISIPYATSTHRCACGCSEIVVTPIKPTDWILTWNGTSVSLNPSIGNWSLPCQSHYWIIENKIIWSRKWDDYEIKAVRAKDNKTKSRYYSKFRKWTRRMGIGD
jgi:hypothetical protein